MAKKGESKGEAGGKKAPLNMKFGAAGGKGRLAKAKAYGGKKGK